MKILLLTLEYPPFLGGIANYCGNLVRHWPKPNDIFVLNNNKGELINDKLPFFKWLPAIGELWRTVKKERVEHILVSHILPLGTVSFLISKIIPIKYSVILHGMDLALALKTKKKRWLTKKILNKAQNIICGNGYTAQMAKGVINEKGGGRMVVVNPGINISSKFQVPSSKLIELKAQYNLDNKIVLLSVGRLVKRKGFDMVLESLPEVLKEAPNLVYVIIGSGPEMSNAGLKDRVILITNASDEERNSWYDICDIFIMPARDIDGDFEGFGIVYLEANLAGKPVIAGDSGGVRDAVEDGINGLLVNPESVKEISQAIIMLTKDDTLRKKMGEQGRERAKNKFNWEGQARKIYKLLI